MQVPVDTVAGIAGNTSPTWQQQKLKQFHTPAGMSGKSTGVLEEEIEIEVEFYNVLFTKHIH